MVFPTGAVIGAAASIGGALLGNSSAKKAAKDQKRATARAAANSQFAGTLQDFSSSGPGGASSSFSAGGRGSGELVSTGGRYNKAEVFTDGGGNLYTRNRKSGVKTPLNQKATINADGSIKLPSGGGFSPNYNKNPTGFKTMQEGFAGGASVDLGDLDAVRNQFVEGIAGNVAAGGGTVDTQINPSQFQSQGFGQAGGFAPGNAQFDQVAQASQFADQAGNVLPDSSGMLAANQAANQAGAQLPTGQEAQRQGFIDQGSQLGATGASQFAAGPNQFAQPQIEGFLNAADIARGEATEGFQNVANDRTALLRQQAQPGQDRLIDKVAQSAFGRGQLGSAGGREALRTATDQIGQQDLGFQLAGQDLATNERAAAAQRASGFGQTAQGLAGQGTSQQQVGAQGFGQGVASGQSVFGQNAQLSDMANQRGQQAFGRAGEMFGANSAISNQLNQRGQERFNRAGSQFAQGQTSQSNAFAQQQAERQSQIDLMRGNIAGNIGERDSAFQRGIAGSNAALGFNNEARSMTAQNLAFSQAMGNQALGAGGTTAAIQTAGINNIKPNNVMANALSSAGNALVAGFSSQPAQGLQPPSTPYVPAQQAFQGGGAGSGQNFSSYS